MSRQFTAAFAVSLSLSAALISSCSSSSSSSPSATGGTGASAGGVAGHAPIAGGTGGSNGGKSSGGATASAGTGGQFANAGSPGSAGTSDTARAGEGGAAGGSACTADDFPFGINASDSRIAAATTVGFKWHRTQSYWTNVEWNRGTLDFSAEKAQLAAHRTQQMAMLEQIPVSTRWSCERCFANGTVTCNDCSWWELPAITADPRASEIYKYVYALVTFLNTQYPDYHVRAFSGFNEIDQTFRWTAKSPANYLSTYVTGYLQPLAMAVHDACDALQLPDCVVLGPTLSTVDFSDYDGEVHEALASLGAFKWFDRFDFHPYQGYQHCDPSALDTEVDRELSWLTNHHLSFKAWATETGLDICGDTCTHGETREQAQVNQLTQALALPASHPWLEKVFLYDLDDAPNGCSVADNGWGLYDDQGNARPARAAVSAILSAAECSR